MRRNNSWLKKLAVGILFVLLQGFSIFLMARYSVTQQAGIVHSLNAGHYFLWERQQAVGRYFSLNTINKELAEENLRLRNELITYKTMHPQTFFLDSIFSFVGAEVVQNTTSSLQNYLIINKGSEHGLEPEMGVIGDQGVVGIVRDVNERYSKVFSLLNTKLQISARIEPQGATGSLAWDGKSIHTAIITHMAQHSQVAVGDTAFTSGVSHIFPARIPLGVVTGTTITQGTFLEAKIHLLQNFNTLRYVYVIKNYHSQEIKDLISGP
jgi:rod shape-determining protein MreC